LELWKCTLCASCCIKPTWCTFYSVYEKLRAFTFIEHRLLILRRGYPNGTWYIAWVQMFRALLAHPQEALPKRHLVYCVSANVSSITRSSSGGASQTALGQLRACTFFEHYLLTLRRSFTAALGMLLECYVSWLHHVHNDIISRHSVSINPFTAEHHTIYPFQIPLLTPHFTPCFLNFG
jgi:hypothetical protein